MKYLKILGHDYGLFYKDLYGASHADHAGSCDNCSCRIYISSKLSEQRQEETLIHEVLEALFYMMGLDATPGKVMELTHDHLSILSEGITQVLRDNDGWWRG